MLMERNAEIIRGWPYDGALDRVEPITSGVTLVNGNWVAKASDNTVGLAAATGAGVGAGSAGLVFAGNGDSASASYTAKAVVLWGNFVAKIANYTAGSYAPGIAVTVKAGKVAVATVGTDAILGYVLDVVAATSGVSGPSAETAHIVIQVA